jgi:protein-L-isoaspartate(D-aspartate) O-methyltransferase
LNGAQRAPSSIPGKGCAGEAGARTGALEIVALDAELADGSASSSAGDPLESPEVARAREQMVARQLVARGIRDTRVLAAMRRVPRHRFVPPRLEAEAYGDHPLPIGEGQTISQPYMVARMTELLGLAGWERVLEIGTGSGYQAAVLAELAAAVYSIESLPTLADHARRILGELGYRNLLVRTGDGTLGWPEEAPFDRVIVTAGAPSVPEPLVAQLSEGGRMVIPVGREECQVLQVLERQRGALQVSGDCECVFVKLIGRHAWGGRDTPPQPETPPE